jgi:Fur family ferric uptake transcriptional regulator
MSDPLAQLSRRLHEHGYRATGARRAILQELVGSYGHVSADELVALVNRRAPRVGRMTVYRTLELLQQLGFVRAIYLGGGAAHYVLLDDGHHHHLVCTRCDAVVEFDDCLVQELEARLGERYNFRVQGHLLEVVGLCEACRERE